MKYLSGADGVDRWTEQNLWNAVLQDVKIVVSTYQILLDALTHAFVKIESLALIVFDEGLFVLHYIRYLGRISLIAIDLNSSQLCWKTSRG